MTGVTLEGKRVLVTGASRGVGLGIARGFARAGAELTILATGESVRATAEALSEDCDREVGAIICDITDRAAVASEVGGLSSRST
jgi:3-hydroxybutyrate dehydrogenase